MREISVCEVKDIIKNLFLDANYNIGNDIYSVINKQKKYEKSEVGKAVLDQLIANYDIAKNEKLAICQDTGMAVVFLKIGQDLHFTDGLLVDAINQGVEEAYNEGYLRKSVVNDPLFERINTKTNTPAIIYSEIVAGEKLEITITAKGFGSENMSAIKMLSLSDGEQGVIDFVLNTVSKAGPNACPPFVVGIGIGGTFEKAAQLAKFATTRNIELSNENKSYADLENNLLLLINKLGIGPAGLGGLTTCLGVNIEYYPTHIAGLPVAINMCCHAARHGHFIL